MEFSINEREKNEILKQELATELLDAEQARVQERLLRQELLEGGEPDESMKRGLVWLESDAWVKSHVLNNFHANFSGLREQWRSQDGKPVSPASRIGEIV